MKNLSKELLELIEDFKSEFISIGENFASIKLSEDKWTLKEIIGHLVDSASNNHQRILRMKMTDHLNFPDYKNTQWLELQQHNRMKFADLLGLFYFYNKLLANIIENISEEELVHRWEVQWDPKEDFIILEALVKHYVVHMRGHFTHMKERVAEINETGVDIFL